MLSTSADGTAIAYEQRGDGPTVVIVNGALSLAADAGGIAEALADAGFLAVTWDRRARGSSGDRRGSTPEDEVADLAAVIKAIGGDAAVLGHSSGAVLALFAASLGVPVRALFLSEPPFRFGVDEPAPDLAERLQRFVDDGNGEDAVAIFQLEGVGLPQEMVDAGRASGQLTALAPLGQSAVYDVQLTRSRLRADVRDAAGDPAGDHPAGGADIPHARHRVGPSRRVDPACRTRHRPGVRHAPARPGRYRARRP